MKRLFEVVFCAPPGDTDGGQSVSGAPPHSAKGEPPHSDAHSILDWLLKILQQDVGYALLDDIRPHTGGSVQLRQPPPRIVPEPREDGTTKLSQEQGGSKSNPSTLSTAVGEEDGCANLLQADDDHEVFMSPVTSSTCSPPRSPQPSLAEFHVDDGLYHFSAAGPGNGTMIKTV